MFRAGDRPIGSYWSINILARIQRSGVRGLSEMTKPPVVHEQFPRSWPLRDVIC